MKEDFGAVEEVLESGKFDVNSRGAGNRTPLHRAVGVREGAKVLLLLQYKADLMLTDGNGLTALHWCALTNTKEVAEVLLDHIKSLPAEAGKSILNKQSSAGDTALHIAAEKGCTGVVEVLLKADADKELRDNSPNGGVTPYFKAKAEGNLDICKLLDPEGKLEPCCIIL